MYVLRSPDLLLAEACVHESLLVVVTGVFVGGDAEDHRGLVAGFAHGLDLVLLWSLSPVVGEI